MTFPPTHPGPAHPSMHYISTSIAQPSKTKPGRCCLTSPPVRKTRLGRRRRILLPEREILLDGADWRAPAAAAAASAENFDDVRRTQRGLDLLRRLHGRRQRCPASTVVDEQSTGDDDDDDVMTTNRKQPLMSLFRRRRQRRCWSSDSWLLMTRITLSAAHRWRRCGVARIYF